MGTPKRFMFYRFPKTETVWYNFILSMIAHEKGAQNIRLLLLHLQILLQYR